MVPPTLLQRQSRLRTVKCLNAGLLIEAEHRRLLRRIQIQAYHIAQLVDEIRVPTHLEAANQMRLQTEFLSHLVHKALRHAQMLRH